MPVSMVQKGKTVCASKRIFANLRCRASLAFSRSSDNRAIRRTGELFSNFQAYGSGKARFALVQRPALQQLTFHL